MAHKCHTRQTLLHHDMSDMQSRQPRDRKFSPTANHRPRTRRGHHRTHEMEWTLWIYYTTLNKRLKLWIYTHRQWLVETDKKRQK